MSVLLRRSLQPLRLSPLFAALPQHLRAGMCASSSDEIQKKLSELVAAKDVVVFMKGVPEAPMCGFSNAVVQILKMHGVENFDAHNVLEDNEIREVGITSACWCYLNISFLMLTFKLTNQELAHKNVHEKLQTVGHLPRLFTLSLLPRPKLNSIIS